MRREDLGFPLSKLPRFTICFFKNLRQVKGMAWTEVYQNTDDMQATSLIGLLLFRIDIGNRNEVSAEALLATVKKHFQIFRKAY